MEKSDNRKEKVIPGDELAVIEEYESGKGTHIIDGQIRASIFGKTKFDNKNKSVEVESSENSSALPQAGDKVEGRRTVLKDYSGPFINQLLLLSAAAAWLSYTLYTVEATNLPENNTMLFTLPFVTFGLFRYLFLLNKSEQAEAPEQLIVQDIPLVLSIICWVAVSTLVLLLNN